MKLLKNPSSRISNNNDTSSTDVETNQTISDLTPNPALEAAKMISNHFTYYYDNSGSGGGSSF